MTTPTTIVAPESKSVFVRPAIYEEWRAKPTPDDVFDDMRMELGGRSYDANWAHCISFPLVVDQTEDGEDHYLPLTEDGRRFRRVGEVMAFDWLCQLKLFFDPVEQRALQTFDWT